LGQTKAEELGALCPGFSAFVWPLRLFRSSRFSAVLTENLLIKIPYSFKESYDGTPEPQTAQDAPWLHGPSLKTVIFDPPDPKVQSITKAAMHTIMHAFVERGNRGSRQDGNVEEVAALRRELAAVQDNHLARC
jgi:hypothetical protein